MLLDLRAESAFQQGFDYASLLGEACAENWDAVMKSLLGDNYGPIGKRIAESWLDKQWNKYLSNDLPQDYLDEISGMSAASKMKSYDVGKIAGRSIVMANFPSDLNDLLYILKDERENPPDEAEMEVLRRMAKSWNAFHCSNFGTWGSRTEGGRLLSGRNLDWLSDIGLQKYKLVTVHHPANGYTHATIGWAAVWGAIGGMNSQGFPSFSFLSLSASCYSNPNPNPNHTQPLKVSLFTKQTWSRMT
jgi:hypothetical protein